MFQRSSPVHPDTFYPRILAAAITAWPNERPPSFVGTSLCRYTLKPPLFKSDKVRPNKVIFCQTPPDKATSSSPVSDLILEQISDTHAARPLWKRADIFDTGIPAITSSINASTAARRRT